MAEVIKEFHAEGGSRDGNADWKVRTLNEMPKSDQGEGYLAGIQIGPHEIRPTADAESTPVKTQGRVYELYLMMKGDPMDHESDAHRRPVRLPFTGRR